MNLEKTFKALDDKNRREILNMLRESPLSAGEISDRFNMSKATTSYHLSILKEANLIIDNKEKNFIIYSLNVSIFEEVVGYIMNFLERD